ncbi:transmembrane protein 236 [Xyrauchen texanus]|uniref:transmembrane protein 236 n=1 Tax=Xyrauchen texanus TaxID=154827 RepID=UPI002242BC3D|nr:transmembrane protein 236 [Xyrauchen texanus]
MGSGSKIKFAICEVLQFASFCVPLFIIMQRFALIVAQVRSQLQPIGGNTTTAYWLIVASSVAYVTSMTMLIWLPMKYMVFMKKKALVDGKKWRPVALAYMLLSTLPCFAFLIASSELQIRNDLRMDTFAELPVSLLLFSLICIDIVERIRHCRLTGQANELARDADIPTMITHIGRVTQTVTPTTGPPPTATNASAGAEHGVGSANWIVRGLPADARAEVFVDSFLFWFDTVEMVRVAGHMPVYFSGWALPIYLFCFLSTTRLVLTPHSPLLSSLGVALQDLPFLILRISLIAIFGFVTPLLYVMKNLLVCLSYIYFNFMTKLRFFNTERLF